MRDRAGIASIAYVLKGFPRLSEIFIASEILRLETGGVPVRLLVLKAEDETVHHPVVDEIRAVPEHLTPAGSVSEIGRGSCRARV